MLSHSLSTVQGERLIFNWLTTTMTYRSNRVIELGCKGDSHLISYNLLSSTGTKTCMHAMNLVNNFLSYSISHSFLIDDSMSC